MIKWADLLNNDDWHDVVKDMQFNSNILLFLVNLTTENNHSSHKVLNIYTSD